MRFTIEFKTTDDGVIHHIFGLTEKTMKELCKLFMKTDAIESVGVALENEE